MRPGATQSTKLLPSSKLTEETHLKTRDRGGRLAPPPPLHQILYFPADTALGPASPASVWSATSVPAVDDNVDKLHKSPFAKPSHDDDDDDDDGKGGGDHYGQGGTRGCKVREVGSSDHISSPPPPPPQISRKPPLERVQGELNTYGI